MSETSDPIDVLHGAGRHAAWMGLQLLAGALAQLAVAAVAVRRMGADEFGQAALVLAVGGLVAVADVGLGASVIRSVASRRVDDERNRRAMQRDLHSAQSLYVTLAVLVLACSVVAAVLALRARDPFTDPATIGFVGLGLVAFVLGAPLVAVASGLRDFRSIALSSSLGAIVNLGIVYAASDLGAVSVGLGYCVGMSMQRALLARHLHRCVPWLSYRPARLRWRTVRPVLGYSAPLVLTAVASQLVSASDLVVLSVFSTATAVGLYRLGSSLPTWSAGALYKIYDVVLPLILRAETEEEQVDALRLASRLASFAAGVGFGFLALERVAVVRVVAGDVGPLATDVLAVFCLAWACNVPAHGVVLLLTARARHHFLPFLVAGEAAVNMGLSVFLVARWGPLGAAQATLLTLLVSNLVVFPALAASRIRASWKLIYVDGLLFVAVGASTAALGVGAAGLVADGVARAVTAALLLLSLAPVVGRAVTKPADRARLQSAFRAS